jgi:hypothetical protein
MRPDTSDHSQANNAPAAFFDRDRRKRFLEAGPQSVILDRLSVHLL